MPKPLLLLSLAVLASAMFVIEERHQSRQLFAQLQKLQGERDSLNTEWGQLLLEEGTWSEHRRVETAARLQLDMNTPARDRIVVVRPIAGAP
ncbi:MAG: cell division protein FtsL [Gammaproteobacteria bacterium]|nr:cell division protein FtsL [Gammaproteobacteria bacterium]